MKTKGRGPRKCLFRNIAEDSALLEIQFNERGNLLVRNEINYPPFRCSWKRDCGNKAHETEKNS